MDKTTYFFIDGNYVRKALNRAMDEVSGVPGELAPEEIASSDAFRTYFYDCVDEQKRESETDAEFKARLAAQEKALAGINSRPGLHLRLGTLKGGRRRAQKEVDILLAVDMLTHGFNRNMTHAILVSGDLDFRPVVEALVRSGIFVQVWFEKRSAAKELPGAADFGSEVTWHGLYNWNTQAFKDKHRPPTHSMSHAPVIHESWVASGLSEGRNVELMKCIAPKMFILRAEKSDGVHWFEHEDREVLDRYFSVLNGPVEWK